MTPPSVATKETTDYDVGRYDLTATTMVIK